MNSMQNKYIIYGLAHPITKELRYVGLSRTGLNRPKSHTNPSKYNNDRLKHLPIYCWVRSLLEQQLKPEILLLGRAEDAEQLGRMERAIIEDHRILGTRLLNCRAGGERDYSHSEATKEKISKAHKGRIGRVKTLEERQKISAFFKGKARNPRSSETKEKIRQSSLGRKQPLESIAKMIETRKQRGWGPPTEETRYKMLQSQIRNGKTQPIQDQNGTKYNSIAEASRKLKISEGGITYSIKSNRYVKGYLLRKMETINGY